MKKDPISQLRLWLLYKRILFSLDLEVSQGLKTGKYNQRLEILSEANDFSARLNAFIILAKCFGTFKACMALQKHGYIRQSHALMKMILEDTSVAYVHFENKLEHLSNLDPTKCIAPLKKAIPLTGKSNGLFNQISHFDSDVLREDVAAKVITKNGKSEVSFKIPINSKDIALKALSVLQVYILFHAIFYSVLDLVLCAEGQEAKYWHIENGVRMNSTPFIIHNRIERWFFDYEYYTGEFIIP